MAVFQFILNHPFLQRTHHEKQPQSHSTATRRQQHTKDQRRRKRAKQKLKRQITEQQRADTALAYEMRTTIEHHFPDLFDQLRGMGEVRDESKASDYELAAHLTACLALFLLKLGSRNQWNQKRKKLQFIRNYKKLFGFDMPHGDSMHAVIGALDEDQVEQLKQQLVRSLLERKVFRGQRFAGRWYPIAIDASGVVSFAHKHCEQCLHKTSKKGKVTYSHQVLEARLVTPNGFSISLATEWVENPEGSEYDKQDCERKAFQRLAKHLKESFPRLSILILADGLYPYEGFFATCREYGWEWSTTFKEGNLSSLWEEIHALQPLQPANTLSETRYEPGAVGLTQVLQSYCWVTGLDYQGHSLNWMSCEERITRQLRQDDGTRTEKTELVRFVHITSLPVDATQAALISRTARLRWKIENEGFNTLKNGGYGMEHKWARKSYRAMKNYYQFMQIAHLIHQLMLKWQRFVNRYLKEMNHPTVKSLWEDLLGAMQWSKVKGKQLRRWLETPV
ncbi:MAG: hypothetical protein ACPG5T_06780, partial [Endozoicomonas sp.]